MSDLEKALASVTRTIDTLCSAVEARKNPHNHGLSLTESLVDVIGKLTEQAIALGKAIAMTHGTTSIDAGQFDHLFEPDDNEPRS